METLCSACKSVYDPSTGVVVSEKQRWCCACAADMVGWLRKQSKRKIDGVNFYKHAFAPPKKEKTDYAQQRRPRTLLAIVRRLASPLDLLLLFRKSSAVATTWSQGAKKAA